MILWEANLLEYSEEIYVTPLMAEMSMAEIGSIILLDMLTKRNV